VIRHADDALDAVTTASASRDITTIIRQPVVGCDDGVGKTPTKASVAV
jgi:hypothetical protein